MGRGRRTAITLGMGAAATISLAAFFHQEIRLAWILRKLDPDPGRLDAFLRAEGAAVSWERLERRFRSQPRLPEQPTQFNPPVEERMEEYMAQDVNAALMDLLGLLSEATSRVTQLLRGGAPLSVASTRVMMPVVETVAEEAPAAGSNGGSALDRVNADVVDVTPKKRGRRRKFNITPEELKKHYIDQGMSAKEIGEKYGVSSLWALIAPTILSPILSMLLTIRACPLLASLTSAVK